MSATEDKQKEALQAHLIAAIRHEEDIEFLKNFENLWNSIRQLRHATMDERREAIRLFAKAINDPSYYNELEISDFFKNLSANSTQTEDALVAELRDSVNKGYLTIEQSKDLLDMWRKHVM